MTYLNTAFCLKNNSCTLRHCDWSRQLHTRISKNQSRHGCLGCLAIIILVVFCFAGLFVELQHLGSNLYQTLDLRLSFPHGTSDVRRATVDGIMGLTIHYCRATMTSYAYELYLKNWSDRIKRPLIHLESKNSDNLLTGEIDHYYRKDLDKWEIKKVCIEPMSFRDSKRPEWWDIDSDDFSPQNNAWYVIYQTKEWDCSVIMFIYKNGNLYQEIFWE